MPNKPMPKIVNGVFGLAFDTNGNVLLTQRNDPDEPKAHLKWQIPGGGQEFGEHPEETLKRELNEELGLTDFTLLNPRPFVSFSIWGKGESAVHVNLFTYIISIGTQTPHIGDEETADWKWYTIQETLALDTLSNVKETVLQAHKIYTETLC